MPYVSSPGKLAMNVGTSWRKRPTACFLARDSSACWSAGRMGSSNATVRSLSRSLEASVRNASARFRGRVCAVARYAVTNTLIRTNSALGVGRPSGSDSNPLTRHSAGYAPYPVVKGLGYRPGRFGVQHGWAA